jgi:Reversibly glycosylated polypeptide
MERHPAEVVRVARIETRPSSSHQGRESMKSAIVVTSINDCTELLMGYLGNFVKYGRKTIIYLIPDLKTPVFPIPECVRVPDLSAQKAFLRKVGFNADDIPFNSDNRRNVGYLMALADGAEMIVSIDDDNYCPADEDFIEEHSASMCEYPRTRSTTGGWYNNCWLLSNSDGCFPRGFPYFSRMNPKFLTTEILQKTEVKINAGMWLGDPDLDAMTWTQKPFKATVHKGSAVLAFDTWCPINSQNTAVHRDLMPAYYFVRMVPPSDRFGDIFQGYFALKVAKHMGWTARFGSPVVTHRRNSHVYLKDVQKEIEPILLLEELLPKLVEHKLTGTTVHEAYVSLADFIESQASTFYLETARLMRAWSSACWRITDG